MARLTVGWEVPAHMPRGRVVVRLMTRHTVRGCAVVDATAMTTVAAGRAVRTRQRPRRVRIGRRLPSAC